MTFQAYFGVEQPRRPPTSKQQLLHFWHQQNLDPRLLEAFAAIPRENFIPPHLRAYAYEDQPLPTIRKQSISQPTTVMIMLQALELQKGDKVFELGAGMGYQAALISQLVGKRGKVVTSDVIPELVQMTRGNAEELGLKNVLVIEGDGGEGYPEEAPYDKIIITAACPTVPQPLIDQLKEGGIVIAPIGDLQSQTMVRGSKVNGRLELEFLGPFVFVPMKGKHGFQEEELIYRQH